jgi:hypothetical protein
MADLLRRAAWMPSGDKMHWTEEQLAEHLKRRGAPATVVRPDVNNPPFKLPGNEAAAYARGQAPKRGMNKTEQAYAQHLDLQVHAGKVLWWRFEPFKLRLADGSYYKPDFGVLPRDLLFEIHETKGFWREAARVRIKVAAELFPFKFIALTRTAGGGWKREEF